jgi:hypothetical protein
MSEDVYFGRGSTPERVAEAMDKAQRERSRARPAATTTERETFFRRLAEEVKRAEAQ